MIKPLFDNVLIKQFEINQSVLVMVDPNAAKVEKAIVLAIGEEVSQIEVGDIIYFKDYAKDVIIEDNEEYILIPEREIKGIVE